MLEADRGTPKDEKAAAEWFHRSAMLDCSDSLYALADAYRVGRDAPVTRVRPASGHGFPVLAILITGTTRRKSLMKRN